MFSRLLGIIYRLCISVNENSTLVTFQELLGEEEYKKVLDKVNADLPEAQKVPQPNILCKCKYCPPL